MANELDELALKPGRAAVVPAETQHPDHTPQSGILSLLGRALFLGVEPYAIVRDSKKPAQRGFAILFSILGLVTLAQVIGYGLGWLTAPRLGSLQALSYATIVDLPWYADQLQLDPAFAGQFQQGHTAAWEALRILLGYPTITATGASVVTLIITALLSWFIYALLAHWFARWYGSRARFGQTLGVLALAYAPLLLRVIEVIPGAVAPLVLIFFLLLATKFLALQSAHGLGSVQTLFVMLAPYLVVVVAAVLIIMYSSAYGLQQTPYFNQAIQLNQFLTQ
jgi:hypothetical protein